MSTDNLPLGLPAITPPRIRWGNFFVRSLHDANNPDDYAPGEFDILLAMPDGGFVYSSGIYYATDWKAVVAALEEEHDRVHEYAWNGLGGGAKLPEWIVQSLARHPRDASGPLPQSVL